MKAIILSEELRAATAAINQLPSHSANNMASDSYVTIEAGFDGLTMMRVGGCGRVIKDCVADISDEGSVIVSHSMLHSLTGKMKGEVTLEKKGAKLLVSGPAFKYSIPLVPAEQAAIPVLNVPSGERLIFDCAPTIDRMKKAVCAAAIGPDNAEKFGGVCVRTLPDGEVSIVASDRARIHLFRSGVKKTGIDSMIPADIASAAISLFRAERGDLCIEFQSNIMSFSCGNTRFNAPISVSTPPNLNQLIEIAKSPDHNASFDRDEMLDALAASVPIARGEMKNVELRFIEDRCDISASAESATFEQSVSAKSDGFEIKVNVSKMIEFLQAADAGPIKVGLVKSNLGLMCFQKGVFLFLATLR